MKALSNVNMENLIKHDEFSVGIHILCYKQVAGDLARIAFESDVNLWTTVVAMSEVLHFYYYTESDVSKAMSILLLC